MLDPVDGTKGFLRREHYAIALSYFYRGKPKLSILAAPNMTSSFYSNKRGALFVAIKDAGAAEYYLWENDLNFKKIKVNKSSLEESVFCESFEHSNHSLMLKLRKMLGIKKL